LFEDAGRVRILGRDPKRGFELRRLVNVFLGFVAINRFLFAGRSKLWRARLFATVELINRFGGRFYLLRRNPEDTFLIIHQIGQFTGFAVDDSRGLRRGIDPFLVPFYFHGDVPILSGAFNSLDNGEIATRGNQ